MKAQRIAIGITTLNLVIFSILMTKLHPAFAGTTQTAPVLRGQGLEIVDKNGKVRASISLQPPVVLDGKTYPETILFRLIAANGKPMVKIGGTETGSALSMIDASDEGLLLRAEKDGIDIKFTEDKKVKVISMTTLK